MDINISYQPRISQYTYTFADKMSVIRFISMCSIVWGHCLLGWDSTHPGIPAHRFYQLFFLQLGKIGTINFFIISGFFLNDKIQKFNVLSYLKHRFFPLILPWLIFLTVFVLIEVMKVLPLRQILHGNIRQTSKLFIALASSFIFHSAYWFIPMSIISALLLIVFKKYISKPWFGVILAAITLFYSINLYHGWVTVNHTKSVLGYTFFMWLGIQLSLHLNSFKAFLIKIDWLPFIILACIMYFLTCREGLILTQIGSADSFASIRLTNSFLSVLLFLVFLKSEKLQWTNIFRPRKYCFGIYLVHCIIIAQFTPLLIQIASNTFFNSSITNSVLIRFCFFIFVLLLSYIIVNLIYRTRLKFILGSK